MDGAELIRELRTPGARTDPYPVYERLHQLGPAWADDSDWVVVLGYAECDRVFRDPNFRVDDSTEFDRVAPDWRDSPMYRRAAASLHFMNPPDHGRVRKLVASAFTTRRINGMRPMIEQTTQRLIEQLAERASGGAEVDFITSFAFELPITVVCDLVGVPPGDRFWIQQRVNSIVAGPPLRSGRAMLESNDGRPASPTAGDHTTVEMMEYFADLVAQRRRAPTEDLASALVAACDAERVISEEELLASLTLVIAAGFITTMNLLGNGLAILLDHPDHLRRLREQPELAPAYVVEMLRYDSPVQVLARRIAQETTLGGIKLAPHTSVAVLVGAANRDPAEFADPGVFDPDRPENHSLSFSSGPHFCLGSHLARLEAQIAFQMLLDSFGEISYAGDPARYDLLVLRGFTELPIAARLAANAGGTR